ncbi:MAG: DUF4416 family protein [Aquificota bacterium]|jgi:hypothetical protein|nr:MAG: DUF4416 family protein [Aquificota bacterium]
MKGAVELAKPILAVLYRERSLMEYFLSGLDVERVSQDFYFEGLQRYYGREMGDGLLKRFFSLSGLMKKEELRDFKLWAMRREEEYSCHGRRGLNIDPGYVDESHLVLASSKRRGGRLYLGGSVYAEIEYLYLYGNFRPLYWTYGDYRDKGVREFFEGVREDFLRQLNLAREGKELVVYRFAQDELYKEVKAWRMVGEVET